MKVRSLAIAVFLLLCLGVGCRREAAKKAPPEPVQQLQRQNQPPAAKRQTLFPNKVSIKLRNMLYQEMTNHQLPGAVLYVATSEGVWTESWGKSNQQTNTTLRPTDRFRIAGISKMFTAVVCLQLVEEGRLRLDEPIAQWLPKSVNDRLPDSRKITVRQLLNHTSGLTDPRTRDFWEAVNANPRRRWTAQEVLDYLPDPKPVPIRGLFHYSDANYLLLELISEKVTGTPLAKLIRQRITTPFKLNNTFMEIREPIPAGFAHGYQDWNNSGSRQDVTQPLINSGLGLGDAGLVSNAPDLVKFSQVLWQNDKLLQERSLQSMMTLADGDRRNGYGLGVNHFSTDWGEAWGHSGEGMGFSSVLMYFPLHDLTIIVWTNDGDDKRTGPEQIVDKSLEIVLGKPR